MKELNKKEKKNSILNKELFNRIFKPKNKYFYLFLFFGLVILFVVFFPYEVGQIINTWKTNFINGFNK